MHIKWVSPLWCQPEGVEGHQEVFVRLRDCECTRKWICLTHRLNVKRENIRNRLCGTVTGTHSSCVRCIQRFYLNSY